MSQSPRPPRPEGAAPPAEPPSAGAVVSDPVRYEESAVPLRALLVPTRNPHANWSYLLGFSSLFLGIWTGGPAVIVGVLAIRRFNADPASGGRTHAIIGIVVGLVASLFHIAIAIYVGATFDAKYGQR